MSGTEETIRSKYPKLLIDEEHLAFEEFSSSPQLYHFTTHRILHTIEPSATGINRRVTHSSIPYSSLQAFSCRISSTDDVPTLHLYTSGASHTEHKPKSTDPNTQTHSTLVSLKSTAFSKEDSCFRLISFLFAKMKGTPTERAITATTASIASLMAWIQNTDLPDISSTPVSNHPLLSLCPIFAANEVIECVASMGESQEDATAVGLCTNQRFVLLRVTTSGKKGPLSSFKMRSSSNTPASLEIQVIPWSCIGGWTLSSTKDGEILLLHTILIDLPKITLSNPVGSAAWQIPSALLKAQCGTAMGQPTNAALAAPLPHWITNESYFLGESGFSDVFEIERYYQSTVPLLQTSETVDLLLFGRRHMILFTPHRIVVVDIQRSQGKVVNVGYRSLLWSSVIVHGIKMAGQHMDQNTCDLLIYTPMMFDPAAQAGSQPGMSLWELDCHLRSAATAADTTLLVQIQQYMTLRGAHRSDRPPSTRGSIKHDDYCTQLQESFAKWKGMPDHAAVAQDCQKALATAMPVLLDDEIVVHCHLIGHGDLAVFTNQRIVEVDTQGWSDQRIVFRSVHYANIRGFCLTTDTAEPELQIYTGNLWSLQKFRISYKVDDSIMAIAKFLASMIFWKSDSRVGSFASIMDTLRKEIQKTPATSGNSLSTLTRSLNVKGLLTSVTDNSLEIKDTSDMNHTLRSDTPLLLENEQIERLFQCGRDFFIYTNYRLLYWDVQGIGVTMFTSWPWKYCAGYSVVTCNTALDRDAELYLYFSIPGRQRKKQSILVSSCDIYNMQLYVSQKVLLYV